MFLRKIVLLAGTLAPALLFSMPAHALLFRAYVASTGNDANPCTLQQPCRLLPAALAAVDNAGEIWMLDSANYNTAPVNIVKSVTILAIPGAVGSVVGTTSGSAIVINTPAVAATLRNLVIAPLPSAGTSIGVEMSAGSKLTIEGSVIAGFTGPGVRVYTNAKVNITGTIFRDNGYGYFGSSGSRASISDSKFFNGSSGSILGHAQVAGTATTILLADSTISNCYIGALADTNGINGKVWITVTRSSISSCIYGVGASADVGTASVTVSGSTLLDLDIWAYQFSAGTVATMGNNTLRHAGGAIGTVTPVGQF